ncbi:MAG TPA: 3-phosphoglycerate dehydrogenase [Candidatus Cloacimonetes bacterium]|nr:3-phosphoglycerate dehydrogenase [Candidatus Cloacimonadota bacterium]
MPKVLIATEKPFAAAAAAKIKAELEAVNYEYTFLESYTDPADLLAAVADVDAMIVRSDKVTEAVLDAAKNLKIVARAGAGFDNVDLKAASARNVVVMNTPGQNANAVAELTIGMMIYLARAKFGGKSGTELAGKKLVLFGFGYIARLVGRMAKGIGMELYAYDPYIANEVMTKEGVKPLSKVADIFKTGDYVSLHMPANDETSRSINWDVLSLVGDDFTLVNTARKELINEDDMLKAFAEKKGFRYVSDVAPDNLDAINADYADRIYCTPRKMGAQTLEANVNAGGAAARQIIGFIEKGDKTFKVN